MKFWEILCFLVFQNCRVLLREAPELSWEGMLKWDSEAWHHSVGISAPANFTSEQSHAVRWEQTGGTVDSQGIAKKPDSLYFQSLVPYVGYY